MSQHPPPPPWSPGPPLAPRRSGRLALALGLAGAVLVVVAVLAVTALVAPGWLVDDDDDDSTAGEQGPGTSETRGDVPPPNATIPPPNGGDPPAESSEPEAPRDPAPTASDLLAAVAAGDSAGVDALMCFDDQQDQYAQAVADQLQLDVVPSAVEASSPDAVLYDLVDSTAGVVGRLQLRPDDAGGWCVETFYIF